MLRDLTRAQDETNHRRQWTPAQLLGGNHCPGQQCGDVPTLLVTTRISVMSSLMTTLSKCWAGCNNNLLVEPLRHRLSFSSLFVPGEMIYGDH